MAQALDDLVGVIQSEGLTLDHARTFLDLLAPPRDLSPQTADELYNILEDSFRRIRKGVNEDTHILLVFVRGVLLSSVTFNNQVNETGPFFFRGLFPLSAFILSPNRRFSTTAVNLAVILRINLPNFDKWTDYIESKPEHKAKLQESLLAPFGLIKAAEEIPTRQHLKAVRGIFDAQGFQALGQGSGGYAVSSPSGQEDTHLVFLSGSERTILREIDLFEINEEESMFDDGEGVLETSMTRKTPRELHDKVKQLIKIQGEIRGRKSVQFSKRRDYLNQQAGKQGGENREIVKIFHRHLNQQEQAIRLLERFYEVLAENVELSNFKDELCVLNRLLGGLYDVSVSIVVSGLINVGKSTVVNCLVGQNIAPNRNETTTSIPVRYLHDATVKEPKMQVPFFEDLNATLEAIHAFIRERGLENVAQELGKRHLRDFVHQINEGFRFTGSYEGTEPVLEASTRIHDLYRLSIHQVFPPEIHHHLPFQWRHGLQNYLTVSYRFPELDAASGLVNISVVDTPGLDEEGVDRLNFHEVLSNAINVSNFALLVTSPKLYGAEAMEPLRFLFHETKRRFGTPVIAIVTHDEEIPTRDRPTIADNIRRGLTYTDEFGISHQTFQENDVFLVSALRKSIGTRMRTFILEKGIKATEEDKDPHTRRLASDWIENLSHGSSYEEKKENYNKETKESLLERCRQVVESSHMHEPIQTIVESAIKKAIPLCIRDGAQKATDLALGIIGNLSSVNSSKLSAAELQLLEAKLHKKIKELKRVRRKFSEGLRTKARTIKENLRNQVDVIQREMALMMAAAVPEAPPLGTFASSVAHHLKELQGSKAEDVVTTLEVQTALTFESRLDLTEAYFGLHHAIKQAVFDYFRAICSTIPGDLRAFATSQQREFEDKVQGILAAVKEALNHENFNQVIPELALAIPQDDQVLPEVTFGYQWKIRPVFTEERKKNSPLALACRQFVQAQAGQTDDEDDDQEVVVDVATFRKELLKHSKDLLTEIAAQSMTQIDSVVGAILDPLSSNIKLAVKKLIKLMQGCSHSGSEQDDELAQVRANLVDTLQQIVPELQALVDSIGR